MRSDNSGVPNTCNLINAVISDIKELHSYYGMDVSEEGQEDVDAFKESALNLLEEIRHANSTLRDWGNEYFNKFEDADREKDEFESETKVLKSTIEDLELQIASLEREIDNLKDEIYELNETYNDR
jgi:uncharacterized coiled-coil DUF342 family protein